MTGSDARILPRPRGPVPGQRSGIQQFLDIGTGLPTTSNVHEVAQAAEPSSHVVYVDNDPLVLAHARARLTFNGLDLVPPGVVSVADWRPDTSGPRPTPAEVSTYGGVARKP